MAMDLVERYERYLDEDFGIIILHIRKGEIKSGKYAHLVKIDKNKVMDGKEFFKDGKKQDKS